MDFEFTATPWLYTGEGAWVFVSLPKEISSEIKILSQSIPKRGFGSVKVRVNTNGTEWSTSIFPDSKTNTYLLPLKKDIRKKAGIQLDEPCTFTVSLHGIVL